MSIWRILPHYNSLVLFLSISVIVHLRSCQGQSKIYNCTQFGLTCVLFSQCSNVHELITSKQALTCGFENDVQHKSKVKVCCSSSNIITSTSTSTTTTTTTTTSLAPTQATPAVRKKGTPSSIALQKCREYAKYRNVKKWINPQRAGDEGYWYDKQDCVNVHSLIVGGVPALAKEYPHMALIGYGNKASEAQWGCGGSLISERFILSAAHCGANSALGPPRWALLGDLTLSQKTEDAKPVNYTIIRVHDHPQYAKPSYYHDISLFELSTNVKLSIYIRPACLHTSLTDLEVGTATSISGWGKTDTSARDPLSDKLLKAKVRIVEDGWCRNLSNLISYSRLSHGYDKDSMICAGDLIDGNDTCTGDSGGPIQIIQDTCMWNVVGVTSFGPQICGDRENPGVYTRVAYYLDWIQSIVWP